MTLTDYAVARGTDPAIVRDELLTAIREQITAHPRSLQAQVGPSELGTPCARKLGYRLAHVPPARPRDPAWRPTVGTAVHDWLETAMRAFNQRHGERFLLEHRVWVGDVNGHQITGRCDLYDAATATVVDWKIVSPSSLKAKKAAKHPGAQYRTQLHLYGRGWTQSGEGLPVDNVMIVALPSSGDLADTWTWWEPYDEQVALDALTRADGIAAALAALGPDKVLPMLNTADDFCRNCDYRLPGAVDLATACPGDASMNVRIDPMTDLLGAKAS